MRRHLTLALVGLLTACQRETGDPDLDIDLDFEVCDGSGDVRLAFSWWMEASTVLEDRFLRRDGLQAFTLDGTCTFTVFDGDHPPHFAWNPVRTGTLDADDLDAFLDVLGAGAWATFTDGDLGEPAAPFHPVWTVFLADDERWTCSGGCSEAAAHARDRGVASVRWLRERATADQQGEVEAVVIEAPGDAYPFHEPWGADTPLEAFLVDLPAVAAHEGPLTSTVEVTSADAAWFRDVRTRFQTRSLSGVYPQTGIGIDDGDGVTQWELYVRPAGDVFVTP